MDETRKVFHWSRLYNILQELNENPKVKLNFKLLPKNYFVKKY